MVLWARPAKDHFGRSCRCWRVRLLLYSSFSSKHLGLESFKSIPAQDLCSFESTTNYPDGSSLPLSGMCALSCYSATITQRKVDSVTGISPAASYKLQPACPRVAPLRVYIPAGPFPALSAQES